MAEEISPAPRETKLRGMRGAIASAMSASLQSAPQLTLNTEFEVGAMLALRKTLSEKVSINTLILTAVARVLARRPDINATLENGTIQHRDRVNLGFAVALDAGLVVPVLRDAQELSAGELGTRVAHLTEQARSGSLNFKDMTDGTFSVTNLGSFGIDAFTPIINLPQVAILGIGRVRGEVMTASLTIDHRAIDGVPGATFLAEVGRELASPALLLATPAMT